MYVCSSGKEGKGNCKKVTVCAHRSDDHVIVSKVWSPMLRSVQQGMKHALNM